MANRICFLLGANPSEYQAVSKFLDSFRQFDMKSQADIAVVFDSEKDQSEFFIKQKAIPKSDSSVIFDSSGDFFSFNSPKSNKSTQKNIPQDESDDEEDNFFFFLGDKTQSQKSDQPSAMQSIDEEMKKAMDGTDSFFFFPTEEPNSQPKIVSMDNSFIESNDVNLIPIVLPKEFHSLFNNTGTFRARIFYALNQLKSKYDYIIVCGSESIIVKSVNIFELCQNFFNQKTLWGNEISGMNRNVDWIKMSCAKWFANTLDWQQVLSPMYLWLNQPFIFRTADIDEFFEVTEILDNLTAIAWTDFPYYIYMYYLILYQGFKIRDIGIKANIGVCESNALGNVKGKSPDFKPMICKKPIQRHLDNENLFIVFGA